jgi:hypothetical protein
MSAPGQLLANWPRRGGGNPGLPSGKNLGTFRGHGPSKSSAAKFYPFSHLTLFPIEQRSSTMLRSVTLCASTLFLLFGGTWATAKSATVIIMLEDMDAKIQVDR